MKKIVSLFKKWYYDLPIIIKLNLTNIFIIVVPMCFLAFFANKVSTDILIEKSVNNSVQSLSVITKSVDSLLNQIEYLSKLTVNNYNVQQILRLSDDEIVKQPEKRLGVISSLDNIVGDQDIISSALIFTNKGVVLSSSKIGTYKLSIDDMELNGVLKTAEEGKGRVVWRNTHPVSYYLGKENVNCVSLFRALIDRKSGETMGAVEIDIDQKIIAKLFLNSDNYKSEETFVINKDGVVVCSSDESKIYKKVNNENYFTWVVGNNNSGKVFNTGKGRYLVTSINYERLKWYIVSLIPLETLTEKNKNVTFLIFFGGLICISFAIIISIFNSMAITKPIISLSKDMSGAGQGDMEVRSVVLGNDEVGNLTKSFNTMMERISDLMDRVYAEQKKKREYELLALQSQINPHFLYNTLESVCSFANKHRNEDVVRLVKSLAIYYRTTLSKGRNVITIREEIENITHYLIIQKIRYVEKFDYTIDLDENILDKPIVKLSLQPIVENSIYHGIKQKPGKGRIWISGKEEGKTIKISIIDDGAGFDESECKQIFSGTDEKSSRKSYGLKNVNDRIKLYFGPEYGLSISSSLGKGTKAEVILPSVTYNA